MDSISIFASKHIGSFILLIFLGVQFGHANRASHMHRLGQIEVHNNRMVSLLGPILGNYDFNTTEEQLQRGISYLGSNHRLRAAIKNGMEGKRPLKVGVIGGSISHGHGASHRGVTDWVSVMGTWLAKAFGNVTIRNGCVPATQSAYMVLCLDMSVDIDVDIVFVEYTLVNVDQILTGLRPVAQAVAYYTRNDGLSHNIENTHTREEERLVRRVLALPHRPPMIMMQFLGFGCARPLDGLGWAPYHHSLESVYGSLAQYYDLPWISIRAATFRTARFDPRASTYSYANLMIEDFIHPADLGHKVMADLAVRLIQQTAIDLVLRPWSVEDEELLQEGLPDPMHEGNVAPTTAMCVYGESMRDMVDATQGFEFIEEGSNKKGYVGLTPGAFIRLRIDTWRDGEAKKLWPDEMHLRTSENNDSSVLVQIGYLKSYQHMGTAILRCVSGCVCAEKTVNAHHEEKNSQTFLTNLKATQHKECVLEIFITEATSSGEHKFKVMAIMVSESAGPVRWHNFFEEGTQAGNLVVKVEA